MKSLTATTQSTPRAESHLPYLQTKVVEAIKCICESCRQGTPPRECCSCAHVTDRGALQLFSCNDARFYLIIYRFADGNAGAALLNGQEVSGSQRGWHAICLGKNSLTLQAADYFDLIAEPERNDALLSFLLDECQAGDILVLFVVGDGATNLSEDVIETLWVLYGATDLSKLQNRDSYMLVSRKSQDGSKCSLNNDGFYEQRSCDIRPPTDVFDSPVEVTRYTDSQCDEAYVQSVWPTDACTGGSQFSTIANCVSDGTVSMRR